MSSPFWFSWSDVGYCLTITVVVFVGRLSDERSGLSIVSQSLHFKSFVSTYKYLHFRCLTYKFEFTLPWQSMTLERSYRGRRRVSASYIFCVVFHLVQYCVHFHCRDYEWSLLVFCIILLRNRKRTELGKLHACLESMCASENANGAENPVLL
jgi:hypothetical protein